MNLIELIRRKGAEVISIHEHDSVATAAGTLVKKNIGTVLVLNDADKIVGILSERDLIYGIENHGANLHELSVRDLMVVDVIKCRPDDDVHKAMSMMTDRRVRHLPVFDGEKLMGIISIGDLVKYRIDEIETEAHYLREYIAM